MWNHPILKGSRKYFMNWLKNLLFIDLNDTCIETYGCRNLKFSECSKDKKCVCKEHHVEKSGQCKSSVGGSCKNDFDCGVDNSVCRSGKCQCSNEFIFSNELRTCIELVVREYFNQNIFDNKS